MNEMQLSRDQIFPMTLGLSNLKRVWPSWDWSCDHVSPVDAWRSNDVTTCTLYSNFIDMLAGYDYVEINQWD